VPGAVERVVIENVRPTVDAGAFPAKAATGLPLQVSATVFADGHDLLLAWVRHGPPRRGATPPASRPPAGWREVPMTAAANDRFATSVLPTRVGPWSFEVVAVVDEYGSWLRDLRLRADAGQDLALEF
jgi:starch synthase (maltosyl-transferring)